MSNIIIRDAREGNLKNISLEIPRDKLVLLTGLSGSGKTTLAMDVIFQECQRQYLETMGLQGINKPEVEDIYNLSPAVMITQTDANKNPRSTVGTLTDIYTDLRMLYEKLGVRKCPSCQLVICAADCKEELEKTDGDFKVYMYCNRCNHRMEKLTRTHYSYNTREGACPTCEGLGRVLSIQEKITIHEELSPEAGAIDFWEQKYKEYQISILYQAFHHFNIPIAPGTPVTEYSRIQKAILLQGTDCEEVAKAFPELQPPKTVAAGRFEGVFRTLYRRIAEKGGDARQLNEYFEYKECPECKGERLCELSRNATVDGLRLPELSVLTLEELYSWIHKLEVSITDSGRNLVEVYLLDLKTKIRRIISMGLGYLTLDRQTTTLSGGELQRLKLSATLDSHLTGIIYILDEPTIGLHSKDTEGMIAILKRLRDMGNTVIVIEHDTQVMQEADFIVDIGPGAGKQGGEIIGTGSLEELMEQEASVTAGYLKKERKVRTVSRKSSGNPIVIQNANRFNLKNLQVRIPSGCLTAVTGVSGSGKSTLIFEHLAGEASRSNTSECTVKGTDQFDRIVTVEQSAITRMKRSNVATYSEIYTEIRKIFGGLKEALEKGFNQKHFSFNSPGGRCENCEGLGYVSSNMLFFKENEVVCPVCNGRQFHEGVLSVKFQGYSIRDILKLSVEEAEAVFVRYPKIVRMLKLLKETGLGYLELGQSLTTLSGGEGQRLKLAKELIGNTGSHCLYLMDEPTTGLHPIDVENFLQLLNRLVDAGNTVIVVEHNQQIILEADWIIDLGPEGGAKGGQIVFEGTPMELLQYGTTATADSLRSFMKMQPAVSLTKHTGIDKEGKGISEED